MPLTGALEHKLSRRSDAEAFGGRPHAARLALFFVGYLLSAGFAQTMAITPGTGISIWAPAGLFLATLYLSERSTWPWWIAAALFAELSASAIWFHNPLGIAFLLNLGNALGAIGGALLLRRLAPQLQLARFRDIVALLCVGVGLAPAISASIGALTLSLAEGQSFVRAWLLWWVGDATGVLVVGPLALVASRTKPSAWRPSERLLELCALGVTFLTAASFSLSGWAPFAYIITPALIWAGARFLFKGAVVSILALTLMTGLFTQLGADPFAGGGVSPQHRQFLLQLFLMVSAISVLVVAAIARQQKVAADALAAANRELEFRIDQKTKRLQTSEADSRLRAAELEAIYDAAPAGIVLLDGDLRFIRTNARLAEINKLSAEDHRGKLAEEVLPAPTVELLKFVLARLRAGEDLVEVETGGPDPSSGEERHWLLSYQAMRKEGGEISHLIGVVTEITERKRNEDRASFVMREVSHRSKNLLALVLAIARQTLRASGAEKEAFARLEQRLLAIGASENLLIRGSHQTDLTMSELARTHLAHFGDPSEGRIALDGEPLALNEDAVSALGMALHELGTNASKYGALSGPQGAVTLAWETTGDSFLISWRESGGPPVQPPTRTGFGTNVIDGMMVRSLGGAVTLRYAPTGFCWQMRCPRERALKPR